MIRHLLRCAVLACIAVHVERYPWNFAVCMAVVGLGFILGAVWSAEVHARLPSPTGWSIPTITPLPKCLARAAVTRKKGVLS